MKYSHENIVKVSFLLLLVLLVFTSSVGSAFCTATSDEASLKLSEAESALRRAFVAVLDAERAGADVSGLMLELNLAGGNLTWAQNAYRSEDFSGVAGAADQCSSLADKIVSGTSLLKGSALAEAQDSEWRMLAFSGIGGLAFALVLFLVWVMFRRSYSRKLLGSKPEVGSDA